jgi:cytochrome b6-f complex iron-sulfur subunit
VTETSSPSPEPKEAAKANPAATAVGAPAVATKTPAPKPAAAAKPKTLRTAGEEEEGWTPLRAYPKLPVGQPITRRGFLSWFSVGWGAFTAASVAGLGAMQRFLFPNVTYEPPLSFKAGFPSEFGEGVDERFKDRFGVWIVRDGRGFYVLSTVCTHLGCTPNWLAAESKFKCPCHGSGFIVSGINIEGPAPRPLERYRVTLADDGQILIDKSVKYQQEKGEWERPEAFLELPLA